MKKSFFLIWGFVLILLACGSSKKGAAPSTEEAVNDAEFEQLIIQAKQDSTNFELQSKLAEAYTVRGQDDDANTWYDKALSLEPDYVPALLGKGDILIRTGKDKDGYSLYLKSLMSDKNEQFVRQIAYKLGQPYEIKQITHGSYDNAAPCFSPNGKMLAFQSNRDGNMEIYTLDIETHYEKRLTNHPEKDEFPVFSPNGKVIAFTSTRDDSDAVSDWKLREIYFMDLEGNNLARFTNNDADDWYPDFNSKSDKLLYVSTRGDIRDIQFSKQWSDIYLHDIKKNTIIRLTESKDQIGTPGFSSNNKWILYNMKNDDYFHIYKMDNQGQNSVQLTFGEANDAAPQFSPNNKQITFFSDRNGNCNIFLMNSDGSNLTQLTCDAADNVYPKFSPDGKKIVFHSKKDRKNQIFLIDLERPLSRDELVKKIETKMADVAVRH